MKIRNLITSFLASVLVMTLAATAWSQTGTSSVTGTVTDQQGNAVAGASVKLISTQGTTRTAVTNDNGVYQFPSVQTGSYTLKRSRASFKKSSVSSFQALVDNVAKVDVALEVGQVTETVNVDAAGLESIVNVQDASLGNNFVSQQILQLPLNARNVTNLLSLQPGVTPDGSVNGGRADQANLTLDGVDVNNQQDAAAFTPVIRINPDSVDEFRVTTSNPDASKGRSAGAQVSLITKSGTNEFHGALYEYHRNNATSANNWFSNAAGNRAANDQLVIFGLAKVGDEVAPREKLIRNLYGGRVGGPILKDRLFFFYNYEALREARETAVTRLVPRASLGAGNVYFVDNTGMPWSLPVATLNNLTLNSQPVVNVNPAALAVLANAAAKYPANIGTLGDGFNTGGFTFNAPTPTQQNAHTARIDWSLTRDQKHMISVRGNYQQDLAGNAPYLPDTPPTDSWSHPLGFSASHTWLINSNITNRFTAGLTRMAFSNQGDSADPAITFRSVFSPTGFVRTLSRTTPTWNFTDDMNWIKGNHSFQFGTNVRLIKNTRVNYARAFDNGITNYSAYPSNQGTNALASYIRAASGDTGRTVSSAWTVPAQSALVALFGRLSGYGANFNFNVDGSLQAENTPVTRIFKTEEYDFYFQDAWKMNSNLTLTLGLRYGLSMPVYEAQGFETVPSINLAEYLDRRAEAMNRGVNYREPISVLLAGKVNGKEGMYPLDKNNFQPRVSVAWSPDFDGGVLGQLFGKESESVFRAGFAITNDYFGQQLATQWDGGNTLGFSSSSTINVNTYSIVDGPNAAPLYTGQSMSIRSLPNLTIPGNLTFPQTAPFRAPGVGKIEGSLDTDLVSPVNYSWNVSYGRRLPGKIWIDAAYVGRAARNLLASRDVMMVNNIRDPVSGMTFNEAATLVEQHIRSGRTPGQIASIPFFDNMYVPGSVRAAMVSQGAVGAGLPSDALTNTQVIAWMRPEWAGDWGYMWQELSSYGLPNHFFQGQYDALSAHGTIASSDYHAATFSLRQRFRGITWDLNYTYSRSVDDSSGLQTSGSFGGGSFIIDAFNLKNNRAESDFDLRHVLNYNGVVDIPIGRGQWIGGGMNRFLDAVIGGWQLSTVIRYDSGPSQGVPGIGHYEDGTGWQTNWNRRSYPVLVSPVETGENIACNPNCSLPNLFSNPAAAWNSFRVPYPGETGSRNPLRFDGMINVDAGLAKSFGMPYAEGHKLTFRWEVFNVANGHAFVGQAVTLVSGQGSQPTPGFGRLTRSRQDARVMQFALRYDF